MILRIVRATLPAPPLTTIRARLASWLEEAGTANGDPAAVHAGTRAVEGGTAVVLMTVWHQAAAAASFDSDQRALQLAAATDAAAEGIATALYEVDQADRPAAHGAGVLRIASGWIEQGPDAEIQQILRSRLPKLAPDLLEAYVGRRIRGRSVEVVLVATWTRRSPDLSLDEPLWPDITARYRRFSIETYEPIAPDGS